MEFEKAKRSKCKIKLSIAGASGSGKTYSAISIAKGMVKNLNQVAVIDTENGSSHLYSHLGDFSVLTLSAPYSPEVYISAINEAIKKGFECIVIDSLSHEWQGIGGIIDIHGQMEGNSFTNWSKVTPRHNALIQTIVNAPIHIIATLRSKTEYVMQQKNGKTIPEKMGVKAVQRDDTEYEFTVAFELNQFHQATISKDRTGMFKTDTNLILSELIGKRITDWCDMDEPKSSKDIKQKLLECGDLDELAELVKTNPNYSDIMREEIAMKKEDLYLINQHKYKQNGHVQY
jgi:hypothetical protein